MVSIGKIFNKTYCLLLINYLLLLFLSFFYFPDTEDFCHFAPAFSFQSLDWCYKSYSLWNPRLGECLSYIIGDYGILFYRLMMPFFASLLSLLIYRIGRGEWPDSSYKSFFGVGLSSMLVLSVIGDIMWYSGIMNWLFPTTLVLLFFVINESFFIGDFSCSFRKMILMFPLIFVLSFSNEVCASLSPLILLLLSLYWGGYKKKKLSKNFILILFLMMFFSFLFFVSPGFEVRKHCTDYGDLSLIEKVSSIFDKNLWVYAGLCFFKVLFLIMLLVFLSIGMIKKFFSTRNCVLLILSIFAFLILIPAPLWGAPRAFQPCMILLACLLISMYFSLSDKVFKLYKKLIFFVCSFVVFLSSFVPVCVERYYSYINLIDLETEINNLKQDGIVDLTVFYVNKQINLGWLYKLPKFIFHRVTYPKYTKVVQSTCIPSESVYDYVKHEFPYQKHEDARYVSLNINIARYWGIRSIQYVKKD